MEAFHFQRTFLQTNKSSSEAILIVIRKMSQESVSIKGKNISNILFESSTGSFINYWEKKKKHSFILKHTSLNITCIYQGKMWPCITALREIDLPTFLVHGEVATLQKPAHNSLAKWGVMGDSIIICAANDFSNSSVSIISFGIFWKDTKGKVRGIITGKKEGRWGGWGGGEGKRRGKGKGKWRGRRKRKNRRGGGRRKRRRKKKGKGRWMGGRRRRKWKEEEED